MIVDSSAIVAVLRHEPAAARLLGAMLDAEVVGVPSACYLEVCMVIAGQKGPDSQPQVDRFLARLGASILPFTEAHARAAAAAFLRYGKGRHPAALNFGDCMTYAVAKGEGAPLLFVGDDFGRTDVAAVGSGGESPTLLAARGRPAPEVSHT